MTQEIYKIQENQKSLESYMRDLSQWQHEMKFKDEELKDKKKKERKKKSEKLSLDDEVILQEALVFKERGNQYFKSGRFDDAIKFYSKGLELDSKNAILAANRAMAYLKLNKCKEAEEDCSLAIYLDPTYVKAYARRASARSSLKRYAEALSDLEILISLEPQNKQAKMEIEKIEKELQGQEIRPRSKTPLKRISIVDKKCKDESEKSLSVLEEEIRHRLSQSVSLSHSLNFVKPKFYFQFLKDWTSLKGDDEKRGSYLNYLEATDYPKIFKEVLEFSIFHDIINILHKVYLNSKGKYSTEDIGRHLLGLSILPRVCTLVLFLDSNERAQLNDLLGALEPSSTPLIHSIIKNLS